MNVQVVTPIVLLLLWGLALTTGVLIVFLAVRLARRSRMGSEGSAEQAETYPAPVYRPSQLHCLNRPTCWLAVKSQNLLAVQAALGLNNPRPCSWIEGLEKKLFIAPAVKGWVLIVGSGLPDPSDDVDSCYRFVLNLSRKLGHVQFFSLSRVLHHHAWVRADAGRIVRAYAWAGRTVWQQGTRTDAEAELDVRCLEYGESVEQTTFGQLDPLAANVEKVPLLAACWSLDPARIDERFLEEEYGIAGEPSRRY